MTEIETEIKRLEEVYDSLIPKKIDHNTKYDISITQKMKEIRPRVTVCHGQGYYDVLDEGLYVPSDLRYSVTYDVPRTSYTVKVIVELREDGFHVFGGVYIDDDCEAITNEVIDIKIPQHSEINYIDWRFPISKVMDDIVSNIDSNTKTNELKSILEDSCRKFESFSNEMIENKLKDNNNLI